MKKLLILAAVVVTTLLMTGCVGEVHVYADTGQSINIGVNRQFVIALGSNPTTGYTWEASIDEGMLELVEKTYEAGAEGGQDIIGAGGVEFFCFKTLRKGETEITLVYKRTWEEPNTPKSTKVFTVDIK